MILLCYDGSEDARTAIAHAGKLLPGQSATVLTVWEPFMELLARTSFGYSMTGPIEDVAQIDTASREGAQARAQEGAELARGVGLDAEARICARRSTFAEAILETAGEIDAAVIVVGSRGLTGVKSILLGSVSHGLIQHADRPVTVVPSEKTAAARAIRG